MENERIDYRSRRTHPVARDCSRVMQLSNGQFLVTVPREITRWKRIGKGTLVRWSDGGPDRIIIDVLQEKG